MMPADVLAPVREDGTVGMGVVATRHHDVVHPGEWGHLPIGHGYDGAVGLPVPLASADKYAYLRYRENYMENREHDTCPIDRH